MRYQIYKTAVFARWERGIRDTVAQKAIAKRLARVELGNLGDVRSVGGSVREMRIFVGRGYRLYFTVRGVDVVILLCGGNKSNQQRDILRARLLAAHLGG